MRSAAHVSMAGRRLCTMISCVPSPSTSSTEISSWSGYDRSRRRPLRVLPVDLTSTTFSIVSGVIARGRMAIRARNVPKQPYTTLTDVSFDEV